LGNYLTIVVSSISKLRQYAHLLIFLILPTANSLMIVMLIDFPPSSRNPNKEKEKPTVLLYVLNPNDEVQSIWISMKSWLLDSLASVLILTSG